MAGERVLVINNEPESIEFLLEDVLLPSGYLVQVATSGREGLNAAQEGRPDLVLLAMRLNDVAYNEVLKHLSISGNRPVILIAPTGAEAEALEAIRHGARDVLVLPASPEEATAIIARSFFRERLDSERDRLVRQIAHSNETLEQALTDTQALFDAGKSILSSLNLDNVLTAVVHAAVSLTQAEEGYLLLRDLENDELFIRASQNPGDDHAIGMRVRVEDSIARQVIRNGEPISLSSNGDASIRIGCREREGDGSVLARSLAYVPLCRQGQVIGVLGVANVWSDREFSASDVMHLAALADSATVALKNAQIHTRTDQALGNMLAEVSAVQHRTNLILRNISDGVYTVNDDLRITSANEAIERITGWRESELLHRRFDEVFIPKAKGRRLLSEQTVPGKALHTGSPVALTQSTILRKDDHRVPVIGLAAPLIAKNSLVIGALGIMREDTPEAALSPSMPGTSAKAQAAAFQLDPLIKVALDALNREVNAATSHRHAVTLRPIISQVVSHFQGVASDNRFQVTLAPDLPFAIGNESNIELALVFLIDNALVLSKPEHPIRISADTSEDSIVVAVEGVNRDGEHRRLSQHALVPSSQGDWEAEQISLWAITEMRFYIASKLIQAQGGKVWTENRSKTSTCFQFSLPRIEGQHVAQALVD